MSEARPKPTLMDYMAIAISPSLIILLVGSLAFFLLMVFYAGAFETRLYWTTGCFVFAAVLISRISIEEGAERASLFGIALGVVAALAMTRFVDHAFWAWLVLGVIWWCASHLVWNCTLVDDDDDASGAGLLEAAGFDAALSTAAAEPKEAPALTTAAARRKRRNEAAARSSKTPELPKPPELPWIKRAFAWWQSSASRKAPPGLTVVYFSLAALPIFGLGQQFIATEDRLYAFQCLFVYVASALGLLVTTSFLGLRRYLRQRRLEMPVEMAGTWLAVGAAMVGIVLILAVLIPRPQPEYAISSLTGMLSSPEREASRYAPMHNSPAQGESSSGAPDEQQKQPDDSQAAAQQHGGASGDSSQAGGEQGQKTEGSGQRAEGSEEENKGQAAAGEREGQSGEGTKSQQSGGSSGGGTSGQQQSGGSGNPSQGQQAQSQRSQGQQAQTQPSQNPQAQQPQQNQATQSGGEKQQQPQGNNPASQQSAGQQQQQQQSQQRQDKTAGQSGDQQQQQAQQTQQRQSSDAEKNGEQGAKQQADRQSGSAGSGKQQPSEQQAGADKGKGAQDSLSSKMAQSLGQRWQQRPRLRPPPLASAGGVLWLLKMLVNAVVAIAVIYCLIRYGAQVRAFLHAMARELMALWQSFFGRRSSTGGEADEAVAATVRRTRPFASYADPFASGAAAKARAHAIVQYSFEALEAWAADRDTPRLAEETPLEFSARLAGEHPPLAAGVQELASLYARVAYARDPLAGENLAEVRQLWIALQRAGAPVSSR
ncbi:MAG TPA: DUF4129 domain-containing protein [Pirellulales bacterium]|nr:DUF4129 domain-containing protein [Pirellulales bacterium]